MIVKTWYEEKHPDSEFIDEINPIVTFDYLWERIKEGVGGGIYDEIGIHDSMIREDIFSGMSEYFDMPYDRIYQAWISDGASEGNKMAIEVGDKVRLTTLDRPSYYTSNWSTMDGLNTEDVYVVKDKSSSASGRKWIGLEGKRYSHCIDLFEKVVEEKEGLTEEDVSLLGELGNGEQDGESSTAPTMALPVWCRQTLEDGTYEYENKDWGAIVFRDLDNVLQNRNGSATSIIQIDPHIVQLDSEDWVLLDDSTPDDVIIDGPVKCLRLVNPELLGVSDEGMHEYDGPYDIFLIDRPINPETEFIAYIGDMDDMVLVSLNRESSAPADNWDEVNMRAMDSAGLTNNVPSEEDIREVQRDAQFAQVFREMDEILPEQE